MSQRGGIIRGMTTKTEVRPKETDAGTGDRFFHYVRKNTIAESAVMGTQVVALCGETFPVTRAAKPGAAVCPRCKEIYDGLPS